MLVRKTAPLEMVTLFILNGEAPVPLPNANKADPRVIAFVAVAALRFS